MWIDDDILKNCQKDIHFNVWIPQKTKLVLGSANKFETECYADHCKEDGLDVYRRYGGGGAVVLHSGCLIISLGLWVKSYFENKRYFALANQSVVDSLSSYDPKLKDLYQDGLSDLCYDGKKIAGTSLFRSRNYLLYQASILCDKKLPLIERYLRHPSKEPDYRGGKGHGEFVTDLESVLGVCDLAYLKKTVESNLEFYLKDNFSEDLFSSQEKQRSHLLQKASKNTNIILSSQKMNEKIV